MSDAEKDAETAKAMAALAEQSARTGFPVEFRRSISFNGVEVEVRQFGGEAFAMAGNAGPVRVPLRDNDPVGSYTPEAVKVLQELAARRNGSS